MAVTRSLSSPSQVLKREARRAQRAGFGDAASKIYTQGVATSLEEKEARGSNIRSYEEENKSRAYRGRAADLFNAQRAALLRGETPESTQSPARSTNASLNEARPGETATQFYARQRESRMSTPKPAAPAATASQTTQQPAPAPKPAAPIDYLDTSGSPMVEQTRAEKDMVRREALQSAYDRLTNPTGAAGSMAEVSAQQAKASAAPAAPTTPAGPTMSELVSGLRESFDRRNAIRRSEREQEMLDIDPFAPVVTQLPTPVKTYSEAEKQKAREDGARMIKQARAREDGARMLEEAKAQESTSGARITGRLIRKAGQLSDAAKVGTFMAADKLAKDPLLNLPETFDRDSKRRKTIQERLTPYAQALKEARREFIEGLQGQ